MSRLALLAARARINHAAAVAWAKWNPTLASSGGTFTAGNTRAEATVGGTFYQVPSDTQITGKVYAEFRSNNASEFTSVAVNMGVLSIAADTVPGAAYTGYSGEDGACLTMRGGGGGTTQDYAFSGDDEGLGGDAMGTVYTDGFWHICVAVDATTRQVWWRCINSIDTGWIGGGDPALGTLPVAIIPGTAPLWFAASGREPFWLEIQEPSAYIGTAPSGFTAGLAA